MMEVFKLAVNLKLENRAVQSAMLFGSMVAAMGTNLLGSIVTSRYLGPVGYGDLKFIQTIWALLALVFAVGLLQSGGRVLLLEHNQDRLREIVGVILTVATGMGIVMMIVTAALAPVIDKIFHTQLAHVLILLSPLMVILPLKDALALALQSTNRVAFLAIINVVPSLLYLGLLVLAAQKVALSVSLVLVLQQMSLLIVLVLITWLLRPRFTGYRGWLRSIFRENRTYGWPVYVGTLAGVASGHLNRLAISYWVDNTAVGFYSLATALVQPLYMIPDAVATSSFRDFARQTRISRKVLVATAGVSGAFLVVCLVLLGEPLSWVYSSDFAPVGPMARVAAFGAILYGLGNLYNRFLGAHGKGRSLRNTAFVVGAVNITGFVLLVPIWKAWGAIAVNVLAGATYLGYLLVSYRKLSHALATQNAANPESACTADSLPPLTTEASDAHLD
jgi:O-antigen/teichoic acid export membrane protein